MELYRPVAHTLLIMGDIDGVRWHASPACTR